MKKILKSIALVLVLVLLGGGGFIAAARSGLLTPNDADLRARYGLPNSKFIDIDGEPIHYVDEGTGDAIVLIHGSFGSLRMWTDWVKALSGHYRVIRFDRPPMGLSGPDPTGNYDSEREAHIVDALTTSLGIDKFFLVATSSGGISGTAYAAAHPERLKGLVLSNIGVGPATFDISRQSAMFRFVLAIDPLFKGWHPQEFWRQILLANFVHPEMVTPALVAEWTDLNNRAQAMPPAPGSKSIMAALLRTPDLLPTITTPTLVLWSADDQDTPLATAGQTTQKLLGAADKSFVVLPNCGHMMPIECGVTGVDAALPFFDRIEASGK